MTIQCPHCGREFAPPSLLLAANVTVTVTCPACGQRYAMTVSMQRLEE